MVVAQVLDVSGWGTVQLEARGSGSNQWRLDPDGALWLYKATRVASHTGELQGEDWAEKLVESLARALGLPTAQIELATRAEAGEVEPGVVSRDLKLPDTDFQNGANLLADVPDYRYRDSLNRPPKNHVGHSVVNVVEQLGRHGVGPPPQLAGSELSAVDVFAGYLVLDAWVGNLDRHEENWAVLRALDGTMTLAPTYDHGAALGSSLTEERRSRLAEDRAGLESFAERGFGRKFEDGAKVPLTTFAAQALDLAAPRARDRWLGRLETVGRDAVHGLIADVPRMSDPARTFCENLVEINRERILRVCR